MKSLVDTIQIVMVMGLMFSFALLVGWAAMRGFFWAISIGLKPAVSPARDFAAGTPHN